MKRFKVFTALAVASVMLLGACSGSTPSESATTTPTPTPTTQASGEATPTPTPTTEAPKEVVMGEPYITYFSQDYGTLNYYKSNKSVDSEEGFSHFIDALIQHNNYAKLVPDIATDWSVSPDGLVWTLKLRDDVMWVTWDQKDYTLLTAYDYETGGKMVLDPEIASVTVDFMLDYIAGAREYYEDNSIGFDKVGIKAVDNTTLQYTMIRPTPFFPSLLTYVTYLPVNEKFLNEVGKDAFGTDKDKILYSGSYTLQSWQRDVRRVLVKNEKYFDKDTIFTPYIEYFSIPDGAVAIELYKRGEISAAGIGTAYLEEIMNDPQYKDRLFVTGSTSASYYYGFNSTSPNKDWNTAVLNENFRKAFHHAFNKIPLLMRSNPYDQDAMNAGIYSAANISVTPDGKDYVSFGNLPAWNEKGRNNYDPALAKEYMAKAKEELGDTVKWPIEFRLLGTSAESSEIFNSLLRQSIEGVFPDELKGGTKIYTSDTYYRIMEEGDYEFASSGWSADYADPSAYLDTIRPGHDVDRFGFANFQGINEYVALLDEAMKITDDIDARYSKFAEAEEILYEHCIIIPYRFNGGNYAINNIQNPYDGRRGGFGLSAAKFSFRIYGTEAITQTERQEQRVKWEQGRSAQ